MIMMLPAYALYLALVLCTWHLSLTCFLVLILYIHEYIRIGLSDPCSPRAPCMCMCILPVIRNLPAICVRFIIYI